MQLTIKKRVFNDRYYPLLNDDTRTQILYGGSSSGKSYFLGQRAVIDVAKGDRNYLICRQVGNTIKKSVFNEVVKAIKFFKLHTMFKINKSDMTITCANGRQILFCGLDDVEKVKSITPEEGVITDIWVEEATETDRNSIKQLYKRLRGQSKVSKRMILSFNPIYEDHWIAQEYFGNWQEDQKELITDKLLIMHTTYKDNTFLTADDVYDLEHEEDPYYYNVYTLGKWGVLGHVIFRNWEVRDLSEEMKWFDNWMVGLDFGFSADPAAVPVTHYDKKRRTIYIFKELYETGLTNDVLATEIIDMVNDEYVVCDSAEPKSIAELQRYGVRAIPAEKGKDSIIHGIQWIQQQKVVIHTDCVNAKREFQIYKWKEDKMGKALRVPVDKDNHLIDALRYAYETESKQFVDMAKHPRHKTDLSFFMDDEIDEVLFDDMSVDDSFINY